MNIEEINTIAAEYGLTADDLDQGTVIGALNPYPDVDYSRLVRLSAEQVAARRAGEAVEDYNRARERLRIAR